MPKLGYTPDSKPKMVVLVNLWDKPILRSIIGGKIRPWNSIHEARAYALQSGYSGVKCKTALGLLKGS
jgi:hypothetical protein